MTAFYVNGVRIDGPEELNSVLNQIQQYVSAYEDLVQDEFEVSPMTASAIVYLRSRSRWTQEKEQELIDRDHAGNPIDLSTVLSGEF